MEIDCLTEYINKYFFVIDEDLILLLMESEYRLMGFLRSRFLIFWLVFSVMVIIFVFLFISEKLIRYIKWNIE